MSYLKDFIEGFAKGARETPRAYFAPLVAAWRWLSSAAWIIYMVSALALALGLLLWDTHQTRQITHVEDLGLAKDVQWLGTSGKFWLMRSPTGAVLTLESPRGGWAMAPDTRLVRKTSANGKRWVCDATMQHCIPTADEQHTLIGAQR